MHNSTVKYYRSNAGKILLSLSLILLLLFLVNVNYFAYPAPGKSTQTWAATDTGNEESTKSFPGSPAGPDEKSPNNPVSITEEYVHEHENPVNPLWMNTIFQHIIHSTEKLRVVHFELLSPPPEA